MGQTRRQGRKCSFWEEGAVYCGGGGGTVNMFCIFNAISHIVCFRFVLIRSLRWDGRLRTFSSLQSRLSRKRISRVRRLSGGGCGDGDVTGKGCFFFFFFSPSLGTRQLFTQETEDDDDDATCLSDRKFLVFPLAALKLIFRFPRSSHLPKLTSSLSSAEA